MKTRIENIAQLVAISPGPVCGGDMAAPPIIEDAALLIDGNAIAWFGPAAEAPVGPVEHTIDAGGGVVTPGLVDCHTHVVFAGSREGEFVRRIAGASYVEILEAGGGIRDSVLAVRAAGVDELAHQSEPRLRRMLECGTTTVEIKSGYGLSPNDEIKMLEAIRKLDDRLPMDLVPTFLGAHAIPPEFDGRPDDYIDVMSSDDLLRRITGERLAEFADVFCERGAFGLEQSRRFLTRCRRHGLVPKVHAEQITRTGSACLGVELGAASVDHLECVDDAAIEALKASLDRANYSARAKSTGRPRTRFGLVSAPSAPTIPVLLPGCSFFLGSQAADARRLIDAGLPLALATDCNPGSAMIESLGLIMSMAATMLHMTPAESLVACTANAAAALRRSDRIGAIAPGHRADLLILDIPNLDHWAYRVGVDPVRMVIKDGRVVPDRGD